MCVFIQEVDDAAVKPNEKMFTVGGGAVGPKLNQSLVNGVDSPRNDRRY